MHDTAYAIANTFFECYWRPGFRDVLEIGACDVGGDWSPGALRDIAPKGCVYTGVDIEAGPGVDMVIENTERLPFDDESFDVVIATSMFEHDTAFWVTFLEMARVLRPAGLLYINAPSNGKYHRYPVDNWRFYPDAGLALEGWAQRSGHAVTLMESFVADRNKDIWNDFCAVFVKATTGLKTPAKPMYERVACKNVRLFGVEGVVREVWDSEDMLLLEEARMIMGSLQERAKLANGHVHANGGNGAAAPAAGHGAGFSLAPIERQGLSAGQLLEMSAEFRRALAAAAAADQISGPPRPAASARKRRARAAS